MFSAFRRLPLLHAFGIIFLGLPGAGSPAGAPVFQVFTAEAVGAEATAWTAAQNSDGLMLFGSQQLVTFDGEQWEHHPMAEAYAVRSLGFGADGRLWAAATGEIGWFDPGPDQTYHYHSLRGFLPEGHTVLGETWYAFPAGAGAVFVSHDRILRWDGARLSVWPLPGQRRLGAFAADGTVYVHHRESGLLRLTPAGPEVAFAPDAVGGGTILWGARREGTLIVATSQGFREERDGKFADVAPEASAFLSRHQLTSAVMLPDGSLAAGTLDGGIALIGRDWSLTRIIDARDGLPTNAIYGLFVDRDGSIWATSAAHIVRFAPPARLSRFEARQGLPAGSATSLVSTPLGLLAATDAGVFALQSDPAPERSGHFALLSDGPVLSLAPDPQGAIVGRFGGIDLLTAQDRTPLLTGPDDTFVLTPSSLSPGMIFAGVGRSVVRLGTTLPAAPEIVVRDLPDLPNSLVEDPAGRLWIGTTTRGLLVAENVAGRLPRVARPVAFGPARRPAEGWARVTSLGTTVVAVSSAGLFAWDSTRQVFQPVPAVPRGRLLAWSQAGGGGRLWLLLESPGTRPAPRHLGWLEETAGRLTWHPKPCEGLSSIGEPRTLLLEPAANGAPDVLWISGSGGLLRFDSSQPADQRKPGRPGIQGLAILRDGSLISLTDGLPSPVNQIVLRFASMEYARRPGIRFQTKLESAGRTWSETTDRPVLQLPIPQEGNYALSVRMITADGVASEPATLHFSIVVPFWRTGAAYATYLGIVLALAYGAYQLRMRTLRAQTRDLERLVRERTQQLEQADAAKTTFVAHLSHEIRNPINGILGASLALELSPLSAAQGEAVKTVRHCSLFLSSLVEDVLDIIKLESGTMERRHAEFDPRALIGVIGSVLAGQAKTAGVVLTTTSEEEVPALVMGDPGRVQQILVNFVLNAIKFAAPGPVELSLQTDGGWLLFTIADRGPGIPEAEKARLFTSFARLNSAKKSSIAGSGLGLAVSRALASHMGGAVGVRARDGGGSIFWLRLPLETATSSPTAGAGTTEFVGACALIVEDVDYNAAALSFMLKQLGFRCDRARNADEALQLLRDQTYDSVFVDYDLPGMSGTELVRLAKTTTAPGKTPLFIATTAYATTSIQRICLEAGMDAFVSKPITPERLRDALLAFAAPLRASASVQLPAPGPRPLRFELLDYLGGDSAAGRQASRAEFVRTMYGMLQTMKTALPSGQREELRRAAHQLVAHARMVGAEQLAALAVQLEELAAHAPEMELAALTAEIEAQARDLTPGLTGPAQAPALG